jgi:NAD(P)-dependent dehydrogenase (short-subunit alcohol dehydrogenase family)
VLAVRDAVAGQELAGEIVARGGKAYVSHLDLLDLDSVRAFAAREGKRPLNLLINNAGVMACPFGHTKQGFENQLGVNHVAHHLLAMLLAPALQSAAPSRVVALSSYAHAWAAFDFDDPNFERRLYDKFKAYGQSKTANALFAAGFDKLFAPIGVRAFSVMPGGIITSLGRNLTEEDFAQMGITEEMVHGAKTIPQGAATTIWAALGHELDGSGGLYLEDMAQALPAALAKAGEGVQPYAIDPHNANRLWAWTEAAIAASSVA